MIHFDRLRLALRADDPFVRFLALFLWSFLCLLAGYNLVRWFFLP